MIRKVLPVMMIILLGGCGLSNMKEMSRQINQKLAKVDEMETKIDQLQEQLNNMDEKMRDLEERVAELEMQVQELSSKRSTSYTKPSKKTSGSSSYSNYKKRKVKIR